MALDYTVTFAGLTIGNGTPIPILQITGLEDLPTVRTGDLERGYADGETPGLDLAAGRDISIDVVVFDSGTGDFAGNIEALKAATASGAPESLMVFQLPGRPARVMNVRARRRSLPVAGSYQYRQAPATIEFHATDPRIYDQTWQSIVIGLPSAVSGLTFPATAPFTFGAAGTGGTVFVTNSGGYPAPWVAQFSGPLTGPTIGLSGGGAVTLTGSLAAADVLTIDSLSRSVTLNGTASRAGWVSSSSVWWSLAKGPSTVQFGAVSGTGQCTFSFRNTTI